MTKTVILDPRIPIGKRYVDLTVDEVLEACERYTNDREFEKDLDDMYQKQSTLFEE
mgnify:CR=1 FL=1